MTETGLRARKKRRTRDEIAAAAARLFAERGYERVSVLDVAAAADVSEQTVYNHFAAKRDLVLDRDADLRERLVTLIRERPTGTAPSAAIREAALAFAAELATMDEIEVRGGLGYLATRSPEVRRLSLAMTDRHADAIAAVLTAESGGPAPAIAKARAIALAWVFQTITDETGRLSAAGRTPAQIARHLRPLVGTLLTDLGGDQPARSGEAPPSVGGR